MDGASAMSALFWGLAAVVFAAGFALGALVVWVA